MHVCTHRDKSTNIGVERHHANNNVHLSCAHQRPEHSHDTYQPKYDIIYTCRAQSYQNNLHKVLYRKTNTHTTCTPTHPQTNKQTHKMTVAETGYCWGENTVRRGTQQQRPEWLTVTLTQHASKYKVHKLHQWYKVIV